MWSINWSIDKDLPSWNGQFPTGQYGGEDVQIMAGKGRKELPVIAEEGNWKQ